MKIFIQEYLYEFNIREELNMMKIIKNTEVIYKVN